MNILSYLTYGFVFIYGIIFGSFYNVIIYRSPLNINIAKGRSKCTSCGNTIKPSYLIPLFSWIFLKGKCAYCGEKISPRYFIIELVTGLLFLLSFFKFGLSISFFYYLTFWSLLLIVMMIDIDHMVIMDSILIFFTIPIVVISFFINTNNLSNFKAALIGFIAYFAIYFITKLIYKKEAFGFGDVLLIPIVSYFLGFHLIFLTLILPFYIAVIYIIIAFIFGKSLNLKKEIPFGPYICISAFILSIFGEELYNLIIVKIFMLS